MEDIKLKIHLYDGTIIFYIIEGDKSTLIENIQEDLYEIFQFITKSVGSVIYSDSKNEFISKVLNIAQESNPDILELSDSEIDAISSQNSTIQNISLFIDKVKKLDPYSYVDKNSLSEEILLELNNFTKNDSIAALTLIAYESIFQKIMQLSIDLQIQNFELLDDSNYPSLVEFLMKRFETNSLILKLLTH